MHRRHSKSVQHLSLNLFVVNLSTTEIAAVVGEARVSRIQVVYEVAVALQVIVTGLLRVHKRVELKFGEQLSRSRNLYATLGLSQAILGLVGNLG